MSNIIAIRTGEPFYDDRDTFHHTHPHHRETPIERASTGGASGRARGLLGGLFGGCMMASQSGGLPYDARVEYLETHRKSYIDTGILPKPGCAIYLDYYAPQNSFAYVQYIAGSSLTDYFYGGDWQNRPPCYAGVSAEKGNTPSAGRHSVKISAAGVEVDGVVVKTFATGSVSAANSFLVGTARGTAWYGSRTLYGRIYSFGYDDENGSQAMRLVPVRVGSVGKFYDTITGAFYDTQDEAYILGPDVTA